MRLTFYNSLLQLLILSAACVVSVYSRPQYAISHGPALLAHAPAVVAHAPLAVAHAPVAVAARAEPYDPHPQYSFAYDVQDALTGDSKNQHETRDGDVVQVNKLNYTSA